MADTTRVNFTRPAAERIAAAVRTVEQGNRDQAALTFSKPLDQGGGGGGGGTPLRICTFSGSWSKGATKTVTLAFQTNTPNTFVATNIFANLSVDCGIRKCAIAREGTAWFLIQAEC